MITGIVLENFKCFKRVEIHPKRITCFVGANGTGKSSVLQAFGLLKQSLGNFLPTQTDFEAGQSLIVQRAISESCRQDQYRFRVFQVLRLDTKTPP